MFEIFVTEEKDLSVFVRDRTIGIRFYWPTGDVDERHEADLTVGQIQHLVYELIGDHSPIVATTAAGVLNVYPRPSYEDLIPPTLKTLGETYGFNVVAELPDLCGNDGLDACCGGGCHG